MKPFGPEARQSASDKSAPHTARSLFIEAGAASALLLLVSLLLSFGASGAASQAPPPLRFESVLPAQQQAQAVELAGQLGGANYLTAAGNPLQMSDQHSGPARPGESLSAATDSWTSGGPYGGYVNSLVMATTNPASTYAVTESGLFKSADGTATRVKASFPERRGPGLFRLHATAPTMMWCPRQCPLWVGSGSAISVAP